MSELGEEPAAWRNYDFSSLPKLLLHDEWNWRCGLSLLSGIDPNESEIFCAEMYYKIRYDEISRFKAETGSDTSFCYWIIQLLADLPNTARRTWYENVDQYQDACHDWNITREQFLPADDRDKPLEELHKNHLDAATILADLTAIFQSNPAHTSRFSAPPSHFISWATSKHIEIKWLEWAKARGYFDSPAQATTTDPTAVDKRERDTLDTLVGALLNALKIDSTEHGAIKKIVGITEDYGAPIGKTAISRILLRIRDAKESVIDRKRR